MSDIIRNATVSDLDGILRIYDIARETMRDTGNPNQWGPEYPGTAILLEDIRKGNLYVIQAGNVIRGCFVLAEGEDPTYTVIEEGTWSYSENYGTIHRLAGNGGGIFQACLTFCKTKCRYLRVDTHRDNRVMLGLLETSGFTRCGKIYVADGSERIAFDYKV